MDSFLLFWSTIILIFVGLVGGLIYFAYWLPKKVGYPKVGWLFSSILTVTFLYFTVIIVFEDELFSKSDAQEKLREHGFILQDDFSIVSNLSGGFSDYSHQFILDISKQDKEQIIKRITSAENFQPSLEDDFMLIAEKMRYSEVDTFFTANYQTENAFIYEYFKPHKQGYAPIYTKILILKKADKLTYDYLID
ncbi:hypothetical protein [Sphingobacterium corticibacterium]|uniref:Uncharacterized protein n=1 Tax=Sphingobacterium corticibacterium TaxID=2484746 RepID=A0A4Q6Y029_9SPHI|nr:hypothetical protein [Sphingobacterium corticibacterium]RZF62547.1 hypothetical protein EWE74_07045 [Sphingobacterium corticibacterium]